MKEKLPKPFDKAMIYEDDKLYICLANYPIITGHTVIVRKKDVSDLHLLSKSNYEYLMNKVNEARNAILKAVAAK